MHFLISMLYVSISRNEQVLISSVLDLFHEYYLMIVSRIKFAYQPFTENLWIQNEKKQKNKKNKEKTGIQSSIVYIYISYISHVLLAV